MQTHQLDMRIKRMLRELRELTVLREAEAEGIEIAPRDTGNYAPFANGDAWGATDRWQDFRFTVIAPQDFRHSLRLRLKTGKEDAWEAINPQFLAMVDGQIVQGLDTRHQTLLLAERAEPGKRYDVLLKGYADPGDTQPGMLQKVREAQVHAVPRLQLTLEDVYEPLTQLCYDLEMPYEAALLAPEGDREREVTLELLAQALDLLDLRAPGSEAFFDGIDLARDFLKTRVYQAREGLPPIAIADSVGHTHIDIAWLWDIEQTRHKAQRSFATVLALMDRYPEYKFMSSQAVLYHMVKEDAPALYERIRERVREGRWEVEGGMWVEADCNLAGGEALLRQFLYGQRFFREEFGVRCRVLWLPDVFGYSAALPQLMRLCGIEYFMTTKLSWSEFNLSPYDTFRWKGIDGAEVLTHFSPARDFYGNTTHGQLAHYTTYNAFIDPSQMAGGWKRFQQKGLDDHFLVCYGYGDGGGGPSEEMLEHGRRMAVALPHTPVVRQQHALPFFQALEERVGGSPQLPKWSGELYLEYHRGTYTAMAQNKRDNRRSELSLREVEIWCAYAARLGLANYPREELLGIWREVLTLQFHDILPGSSIKKVYDDSAETYGRLLPRLAELRQNAQRALTSRTAGDVVVFNSLSYARDDLVRFSAPEPVRSLRDAAGTLYPVQRDEGEAVAYVRGLAPMGATPFWFSEQAADAPDMQVDAKGFDTPFYKGEFDAAMRLTSLFDKRANRELVKPGETLNRLICYENKPHQYDAWDMNIYYDRRHWDVDDLRQVEVVSRGPVLSRLRCTYRYMRSTITQDIVLYRESPQISFPTRVDWQEQQYLLKAHFPVDLLYNEASYDIQYGNVRRPTHKNTSWDVARFEVCAHKWADVSEDGYGVALLNDCKYGHSIDERSMALTLLKSSTDPNPVADIGMHHFTYALLPHVGGWRESDVVRAAYQLNVPVLTEAGSGGEGGVASLARVDLPNVLIEAVKAPEDEEGLLIRLYECFGRRVPEATLRLGFAPEQAWLVNGLEEKQQELKAAGDVLSFELKPYEIKSFLIK